MKTLLNPYLNFRGNTREAMEFYHSVFGGKIELHTFKEFNASQDPSDDNLIMHSMVEADNGVTFMAADMPPRIEYTPGNNYYISLSGGNEAELRGYFEKLSVGGKVNQPLTKAQWGDTFGDVTDKFGVKWLMNIAGKKA